MGVGDGVGVRVIRKAGRICKTKQLHVVPVQDDIMQISINLLCIIFRRTLIDGIVLLTQQRKVTYAHLFSTATFVRFYRNSRTPISPATRLFCYNPHFEAIRTIRNIIIIFIRVIILVHIHTHRQKKKKNWLYVYSPVVITFYYTHYTK